jgi:hypothetical protein
MSRRYFGTDGIRGTVGQEPITPDFMLRLGHAVGRVLKQSAARRSCACTMWQRPSMRLPFGGRSATITRQDNDEQTLFRHRRHPRHGGPGADHARLHVALGDRKSVV